MKPSDIAPFRERLENDLRTIQQEVAALFVQRQVFEDLKEPFIENRTLNREWTPLHTFLFVGYVTQACMRLRRLMDVDGQTVSLANIVSRVCQHPEVFTRADYSARFVENCRVRSTGRAQETENGLRTAVREHREAEANELFSRFAGPGALSLEQRRLCRFCLPAKAKWAEVGSYVDKRLAHYDRREPQNPTWGELDDAVHAVGDLYINVQLLLTGIVEEREDLARAWQWDDWRPLLEVPWRTGAQAEEDAEVVD